MNTYQKAARLFIGRDKELESQEGNTQGDIIATAYCAIGIKPLVDRLEGKNIVQWWFADDASCLAELLPSKEWWDQIKDFGPKYCYFPNASRTWLICKSEKIANEAKRVFESTGVNIIQTTQKHLGAVIGGIESCSRFAGEKIKTWRNQVRALSKAAQSEPHFSYIVYTRIL